MEMNLIIYWVIPAMICFLIFLSGIFTLIKYSAIYHRVGKLELSYFGLFNVVYAAWAFFSLEGSDSVNRRGICLVLFPIFYMAFVCKTSVESWMIARLQKVVFYYSLVFAILWGVIFLAAPAIRESLMRVGYVSAVLVSAMALPGVLFKKKKSLDTWNCVAGRLIFFLGLVVEGVCFLMNLEYLQRYVSATATAWYVMIYNLGLIQETAEQVKETIRMKEEQLEGQMQLMIGQINPHFIFNSLNCILALIRKNPEEACDAVYQFSKYLRADFDSLASDGLITFEQELTQIRAYLKLEEKRFPARIRVEMDLQATEFLMPALTVQTFVECMVKYGLSKCKEEGFLFLAVDRQREKIRIRLDLSGKGIPKQTKRELEIIKKKVEYVRIRLEKLPGAELNIELKNAGSVRVLILLPYRKKENDEDDIGG